MTDINASLKKTINNEPGPQYKEKGKAEFNFSEGENGVPYSYDKKVESRLAAIENKLDGVIENGSINTQLTGSNVANGIAVKQISKNVYFKELVISNSTPLAAGKDEIIDIHAKAGEIWRIVRFGFEVSRNSESTGTYEINLHHGSNQADSNWIAQFKRTSNQFLRGTVPGRLNQDVSYDPIDRMELMESIRNTTIVSDVLPMRIRLGNASDKDMGTRQFRIFYYAEAIGNE